MRSYSELITRNTFLSRFKYLHLGGSVGAETFGVERQLNQSFYTSRDWKQVRDLVLIRDEGCDLGIPENRIMDKIIVHHMNPLEPSDFKGELTEEKWNRLFGQDNLICASILTHNAIHFGGESQLPQPEVERRPGDTIGWVRSW